MLRAFETDRVYSSLFTRAKIIGYESGTIRDISICLRNQSSETLLGVFTQKNLLNESKVKPSFLFFVLVLQLLEVIFIHLLSEIILTSIALLGFLMIDLLPCYPGCSWRLLLPSLLVTQVMNSSVALWPSLIRIVIKYLGVVKKDKRVLAVVKSSMLVVCQLLVQFCRTLAIWKLLFDFNLDAESTILTQRLLIPSKVVIQIIILSFYFTKVKVRSLILLRRVRNISREYLLVEL